MIEIPQKLQRATKYAMRILRSCKDLTDKVPKQTDSKYEKIVKTGAILESVFTLAKEFKVEKDPYLFLTENLKLVKKDSVFLTKFLYALYKNDYIAFTKVPIDDKKSYIIFNVGEEKIAIYLESDTATPSLQAMYCTPNADISKIINNLWKQVGNRISVTMPNYFVKINKIILNNDEIFLFNRSDNLLDLDIGNCFLITGMPGCGKTSFTYKYAEKNNKKLVEFDPNAIKAMGRSDFVQLLKNLQPDIILFDDFDRTDLACASAYALKIFEVFHNEFPNIMFILISNYPEKIEKAMFRNGRIDYVIEFDAPNEEERRIIISKYVSNDIEELVRESSGLSHSDLVGLAKKAAVIGPQKALIIIQHLKKFQSRAHAFEFKKHELNF